MIIWAIFFLLMNLMKNSHQVNAFWERSSEIVTLKMCFLKEQLWKNIFESIFFGKQFSGSNFEYISLGIYFFRKQFLECIFKGAVLRMYFWECIFWESNFEKCFLSQQFWKYIFWESDFESVFFEGSISKESNEE